MVIGSRGDIKNSQAVILGLDFQGRALSAYSFALLAGPAYTDNFFFKVP